MTATTPADTAPNYHTSGTPEIPARNPRRWWILLVLCLCALVLMLDNLILNVAIPQIAGDLDAGAQDIQWMIDSYILVFAGLLLTAGSLSDRFGRRRLMLIGLTLFGGSSLIAALASSPAELIGARALMGIGGALIMPATLSILITVFDDEERPKAMGALAGVSVLGMVGGPLLGGQMLAHFWWGSIFLINVPVAALAALACITLMPESKGPWRKPDFAGMALSVVSMTALVWTIIEWPTHGIDERPTQISLGIAVVGLIAFVIRELTTDSPMVPMGLFRNRTFTGSSFSMVLMTFANGGLLLVLTQYLQYVLEYSPTKTGLSFTPLAIAVLIFNGLAAALAKKLGNNIVASAGLAVIASGFGLLSTLEVGDGFWLPATAMAVMGAGMGMVMPTAMAALMSAIPGEHAGVGSALNDTIQQAGGALGVAVLGSVLASTFTDTMPESAPAAAKHSVGEALAVAKTTGDAGLVDSAREAFTSAMSTTFVAGAVSVLGAAVLALVLMRGKAAAESADPDRSEVPVAV
ncbi:MAG: MFS transporter [Mycobacteriaceae bacterium]|nr:MFS transporter [Mycobacteriaceae bacterium]